MSYRDVNSKRMLIDWSNVDVAGVWWTERSLDRWLWE